MDSCLRNKSSTEFCCDGERKPGQRLKERRLAAAGGSDDDQLASQISTCIHTKICVAYLWNVNGDLLKCIDFPDSIHNGEKTLPFVTHKLPELVSIDLISKITSWLFIADRAGKGFMTLKRALGFEIEGRL